MTALAASKNLVQYGCDPVPAYLPARGLAASAKVFAGSMVGVNQLGGLVAVSADPAIRVVGVSEETVDNTGGLINALYANRVRRGVFGFVNSGTTAALTAADIGATCFAQDDQTVARTDGLGLRPPCGRVVGFEGAVVLVELGVFGTACAGIDDHIVSAADLTAAQYKAVKIDSAGKVDLCGAGEPAYGILQNAPAADAIAIVRILGTTLARADGTGVTRGNAISSAAAGVLRATTNAATGLGVVDTGDAGAATDPVKGAHIIGRAVQTAAASALFKMAILHSGVQATTAV